MISQAQPSRGWSFRRALGLTAAVLAVLAAALVVATTTGGHPAPPAPREVVGAPAPGALSYAPNRPNPAAAAAARTFLSSYLAYLYGRASARQIQDASPKLVAALARRAPAVGSGARKLHPVIVGLGAEQKSGNVLDLTALISDGIARYPVWIEIVHNQRGWETTRLSDPE